MPKMERFFTNIFYQTLMVIFISIMFATGVAAAEEQGKDSSGEAVTMQENSTVMRANAVISRLTPPEDEWIKFPAISGDGSTVVYVSVKDGVNTIKALEIKSKKITSLFTDGVESAPNAGKDFKLVLGTKPPVISDDGSLAVFALSSNKNGEGLKDHYLASVSTSSPKSLKVFEILNPALGKKETWEFISIYDVSEDGSFIAAVVKGTLAKKRGGYPSAIITCQANGDDCKVLLGPQFKSGKWIWEDYPRKPLTGGGWAFDLEEDKILFGAQSSSDNSNYDIFIMDLDGKNIKQITQLMDKMFNGACLGLAGERATFFYTGSKASGVGTYSIGLDGKNLKYLRAKTAERVDLEDISADGAKVVFPAKDGGSMLQVVTGKEILLFDANTKGYVAGQVAMAFPSYPSFWIPQLMSDDGKNFIISGYPADDEGPALYLLQIK